MAYACICQNFFVPLRRKGFCKTYSFVYIATIKLNTLMRKLLFSMLIFFSVATMATEQNVVAIYPLQGEAALFAFADQPELTYTATDLVLTTTQTSVQYPISNLRKVAFERADVDEAIENIEIPECFSFRDGQIIVNGGKANSLVNLYSTQGTLLRQLRLDDDGNGAISTQDLRGMAIIVQNGSITFKFMQP